MAPNFEPFYGGNRRRSELWARKTAGQELSSKEEAELHGYNIFSNNPEAANLLAKDILGQTTPEERAKLDEYFQHKNQREKFSPEVNYLWDRVEAGDSNVEQVDMSQGKAIKVSPGDKEKRIWTFGLGGCYACLVFTEHPDGTRNAVLTHYPETEILQNLAKLRELIDQSEKMKEASTKQVVLMAPGEWVQNPTTKEWFLRVKNQQIADLLTLAVQVELECGVYVKLEPYSEMLDIEKKDQGTLLVYVPPVGKGEAHYRTWFSGGTLGTQEPKN